MSPRTELTRTFRAVLDLEYFARVGTAPSPQQAYFEATEAVLAALYKELGDWRIEQVAKGALQLSADDLRNRAADLMRQRANGEIDREDAARRIEAVLRTLLSS